MRILVTGATATSAAVSCRAWSPPGTTSSAWSRDPARLAGRRWQVDVRRGDVLDPDTLGPALQGVEVAYYLVHAMGEGARGFEERDERAARNFARAASAAGVQRIVYLGGLGGGETASRGHLASRQHVGEVLRSAGVPVTEFRAAVVDRLGQHLVRDDPLPHRAPAGHDHAALAHDALPADRHRRRAAYLAGCLDEPAAPGAPSRSAGPRCSPTAR